MNTAFRVAGRYLFVPLLVATTGACAGMGTLSDVLAAPGGVYGSDGEVRGEVRSIDSRRQELHIQSGWRGTERIRYDGRTEVIYQQRRYSVRDLERGDVIRVQLETRSREPYANRILVERSVRDRYSSGRADSRLERLDGSVVGVDTRRGMFQLQVGRGRVVTVALPNNPGRAMDDRFRRLRRGQRIRLEGYLVNNSRVELMRFM